MFYKLIFTRYPLAIFDISIEYYKFWETYLSETYARVYKFTPVFARSLLHQRRSLFALATSLGLKIWGESRTRITIINILDSV